MNRFSQLIFLAGFLWLGFSVCAARESPGHGMYVWERAVSMTDGGADDRPLQIEMLEFCRRSAIDVRRIYFLVDFERADPASLSNLLRRAQRYDVEIFALHPGSLQNEWAREFRKNKRCDHDVVLHAVETADRPGKPQAQYNENYGGCTLRNEMTGGRRTHNSTQKIAVATTANIRTNQADAFA